MTSLAASGSEPGSPRPLPWQDTLWSSLQAALAQGRLAHALLLAGPAGIGKRAFASALVAGLLCERPEGQGFACGNCRSCAQRVAGSLPNRFSLAPEMDERTGKAKRDISIDQVRRLTERITLSSHYGSALVALIDPADSLSVAAVNALLKTIEEPLPGRYLLLITERPAALAPTLRSRCQRLSLPLPEIAEAKAWLSSELGPKALDALSTPRLLKTPLKLRDWHREGRLSQRSIWREELLGLAERPGDPLVLAKAPGADRELARLWIEVFQELIAELLRARAQVDAAPALRRLAERIPFEGLGLLASDAVETQRRLAQTLPPLLAVESLIILWWRWARPTSRSTRFKDPA